MPLLTQTVLPSQTITSPTWTDPITLPAGCREVYLSLGLDDADLASSKTIDVETHMSLDGGATWAKVPGGGFDQPWQGPGAGPLMLGATCVGFAGAMLKALLTPDAAGITTDATVEVL